MKTPGGHIPYEPQFLRLGGRDRHGEPVEDPAERAASRRAAHATLKGMTGRDFCFDPEQWRAWMDANPDWIRDRIRAYVEGYRSGAG